MVATAIGACLLTAARQLVAPDQMVIVCLVTLLTAVLLHFLVVRVFGFPCPACSRWSLRQLARHHHYYLCTACRARFKRFGFGPWEDASGPDDAFRYHKPREAGVWKGYVAPDELDDTTCGRLLHNKREETGLIEGHPRPHHDPKVDSRLEAARIKVRTFLAHLQEMRE
jgi:hypothetical protein